MYFVKWLMTRPIIAFWVLGAIAILLTAGGGNNESENTHNNTSTKHIVESTKATTQHHIVAKHDETKNEISSTEEKVDTQKTTITEHNAIESVNGSAGSTVIISTPANSESTTDTEVETIEVITPEDDSQEVTAVIMEATTEADVQDQQQTDEAEAIETEEVKTLLTTEIDADQNDMASTENEKAVIPHEGSDITQITSDELLTMAREAYWNNGFDESAGLYTQLIKQQPNVMEYKGELGNVYWRQGYPKKAAELYSEIAIPMLQIGDTNRVANMVGLIGIFYPEKAKEIHQQIMLMQGAVNQ